MYTEIRNAYREFRDAEKVLNTKKTLLTNAYSKELHNLAKLGDVEEFDKVARDLVTDLGGAYELMSISIKTLYNL